MIESARGVGASAVRRDLGTPETNDSPSNGAASVLVIDDDEDIRFTIASVLEEAGFLVAVASGARQALDYLRTAPLPELILLDLSMPDMDGAGFRSEQQKDPAHGAIPTLVLTAAAYPAARIAPLEVEGYLAKPVDLDRLIDTVGRYCPRRR